MNTNVEIRFVCKGCICNVCHSMQYFAYLFTDMYCIYFSTNNLENISPNIYNYSFSHYRCIYFLYN